MQLTDERDRLRSLQQDLERELASSQLTHTQLAEQRSENERLKEVIDTLKCDLDQARHEQLSGNHSMNTSNLIKVKIMYTIIFLKKWKKNKYIYIDLFF